MSTTPEQQRPSAFLPGGAEISYKKVEDPERDFVAFHIDLASYIVNQERQKAIESLRPEERNAQRIEEKMREALRPIEARLSDVLAGVRSLLLNADTPLRSAVPIHRHLRKTEGKSGFVRTDDLDCGISVSEKVKIVKKFTQESIIVNRDIDVDVQEVRSNGHSQGHPRKNGHSTSIDQSWRKEPA